MEIGATVQGVGSVAPVVPDVEALAARSTQDSQPNPAAGEQGATAGEQGKQAAASVDAMRRMAEIMNEARDLKRSQLRFSVAADIDRVVIAVTDRESGELVRQIPPDVILRVARGIEAYKGLMFNERV